MTALPQRKHLTRLPVWLPLDKSVVYFVTACCAQRRAVFVNDRAVQTAVESLQRVEERLGWRVEKVCFMPDHVHLLLSPLRDREQSLSQFMQRWKTSSTLRLGGEIWQREFFDHLLRSDEKLEEKWNYVRENPVRAGLCANPDAYPYSGTPAEMLTRINCRAGTPNGLPAAKGNPTSPAARTPEDGDARPTMPDGEP